MFYRIITLGTLLPTCHPIRKVRMKGQEGTQAAAGQALGYGCVRILGARLGQSDAEAFLPPRETRFVHPWKGQQHCPGATLPLLKRRDRPSSCSYSRCLKVGGGSAWSAMWEKDLGTLVFPSLTQTFNKVKARCGPILFTDLMGKNHLCKKVF